MRLNMDCIRDILLWVESITTPTKYAKYLNTELAAQCAFLYDEVPRPTPSQKILTEKYENEVIVYHLNYCFESGLLKPLPYNDNPFIGIQDLTPLGHELLSNIRNEENFNIVKQSAKKIGIESVKSFIDIAKSVSAEIITKSITG